MEISQQRIAILLMAEFVASPQQIDAILAYIGSLQSK
jgi:hypothetical protein